MDSFTVLHIKLLKFLNEPKTDEWINGLLERVDYQEAFAGSVSAEIASTKIITFKDLRAVLGYEFPEFHIKERNYIYYQALRDLNRYGMIPFDASKVIEFTISRYENKLGPLLVTFLGKKFLEFISSPIN